MGAQRHVRARAEAGRCVVPRVPPGASGRREHPAPHRRGHRPRRCGRRHGTRAGPQQHPGPGWRRLRWAELARRTGRARRADANHARPQPTESGFRQHSTVCAAAAPLDPPVIVQDVVGIVDTRALEEHHQVVIAVGGAEDFLPTVGMHGHFPTSRACGRVYDDRRAAHASQRASDRPVGRAGRSGQGVSPQ